MSITSSISRWMRIFLACAAIGGASLLPFDARAFDRCTKLFSAPSELREFLSRIGVQDAPMKYFDRARSIRIETDEFPGGLFPFAKFDLEGRPVIVFPANFPPLLCRMVLAEYLVEDGQRNLITGAAQDAANCLNAGNGFDTC